MRKNSNILMLIAAILAFVPVLAADFIVDNFVRLREGVVLQRAINAVTEDAQAGVYNAIELMGDLLADSPSLCTPTFAANLRTAMMRSQYLRQLEVQNVNGVQYCEAMGGEFTYITVSEELSIPGRPELLTAVEIDGVDVPVLKITRIIDANRRISAFVNFSNLIAAGRVPTSLGRASYLRVALADGSELHVVGDITSDRITAQPDQFLFATALAGDVPVRAEVAVRFDRVRAEYSDLYVLFTFVVSMMSGAFLLLALRYVRRSNTGSLNLERAVVEGEIVPWYQPVIDLETGNVIGCEMLARWIKPNGDVVSPGVFIEYAELTGLAIPMTISLMEQMKEDLAPLAFANPDMKFSINLFEGHFRDGSIVGDVEAIFGGSSIAFNQLVFEITERQPLAEGTPAQTVINGLQALGAKLALDDVGTGHSNLASIQNLGVDILKIDGIFVQMIQEEDSSAPVLEALINMAKQMNATIVAEGVETVEQARYLRAHDVTQVQGFLFAKPLPIAKFREMTLALNSRPTVVAEDEAAQTQAA